MQRYRNNRRDRSAAKRQKLPGVRLPPGITQPAPMTNADSQFDKDACEGVAALQKLFDGKAVAPSPVVKKLLEETRPQRKSWLQSAISVHTVLKIYPVFKHQKWVCLHIMY